jgi:hypothetical protein
MQYFLYNKEEKFAKNVLIFLSQRSDQDPVQLFLIRPGQEVSDPDGFGSTTLSSESENV